ncbi:MAG TPA: hypothetical protein VF135_05280 [Terriglobales bacterium]
MRSRRRNLLIVTLSVAVVAAAIALAVYLRKRAAPEPARLLPNSDAVLYFNLKSVRRLTSFGSQPIGGQEPEYENFVRETGFRFEHDLNDAAFAVHIVPRPPAFRGGPPTTELRYSEVFVGKFDSQRMSAYLRKLSKSVDRYRETDIFSIPVEDRTVRVAILDVDSVAASNVDDPGILRGIIDRSRSAAMPFSGPPLISEFYKQVPIGSMVWAIVRIPPPPSDPRAPRAFTLPGGLDVAIPADTTMVASARYLGSIHARAEFFTGSEVDAKKLSDQVSGFLTLFKAVQQPGQPNAAEADIKTAIDSLKIEEQGARVILSAVIPNGIFKSVLEEPPVDVTGTKQEAEEQQQKQSPEPKKAPARKK